MKPNISDTAEYKAWALEQVDEFMMSPMHTAVKADHREAIKYLSETTILPESELSPEDVAPSLYENDLYLSYLSYQIFKQHKSLMPRTAKRSRADKAWAHNHNYVQQGWSVRVSLLFPHAFIFWVLIFIFF